MVCSRFLFAVPRSYVGYRIVGAEPVDLAVKAAYERNMESLVLTLAEWTDPCVITLTPEANGRLLEYERGLEPKLAPGNELGHLADWGSKLAGAVVRIAGLLHLASNFTTGYREPVSVETLTGAIEIGNYFLDHACMAVAIMGADPSVADAQALLAWIGNLGEPTFTKRDAHRAHQSRFAKVADLDPALATLESHGWIRRRPDDETRGPGRRPSPTFDVHPSARDHVTEMTQ